MKETERFQAQLDRFESLLDEFGRLLVSLNGGIRATENTPQVSEAGTRPPFILDEKSEAAIDRYIKDWRDRMVAEDA